MEALFIHLVDVHATVVVMMMGILLRVSKDVDKAFRRRSWEGRARKRLAEDGHERQKDHQLAHHAPILWVEFAGVAPTPDAAWRPLTELVDGHIERDEPVRAQSAAVPLGSVQDVSG